MPNRRTKRTSLACCAVLFFCVFITILGFCDSDHRPTALASADERFLYIHSSGRQLWSARTDGKEQRLEAKLDIPEEMIATEIDVRPNSNQVFVLYGEKRNRSEDEHYARPLTSGAVFVDMKMRKQKKVGANLQQGRWSPDGKRIAFLRKYDVWLWEPQSGRQKQASHLYLEDPKAEGSNSSTGVVEFAWIERGQAIATHESRLHGTGCNDISALDLPADKIQLLSSCRFAGCRHSLSSTPEGAVSWIEGDEVRVHDGKTSSSVSIGNEETCRYYSDSEWDIIEGRSGSLAWSPDGKHIAVYKQDLGILDAATGKELRVLPNAKNAFWLNATDFLYAGQKGIYSYRLGDASGKLIVLGGSISRQSRILLKEQRALSQDGRNTR